MNIHRLEKELFRYNQLIDAREDKTKTDEDYQEFITKIIDAIENEEIKRTVQRIFKKCFFKDYKIE